MLNMWSDSLGTIAGILLGIAIPAHEALRTRKAIDVVVMESTQETQDAFDAVRILAEQAVCGLSDDSLQHGGYFATTYNRSRIEHALKRVEAVATSKPSSRTAST